MILQASLKLSIILDFILQHDIAKLFEHDGCEALIAHFSQILRGHVLVWLELYLHHLAGASHCEAEREEHDAEEDETIAPATGLPHNRLAEKDFQDTHARPETSVQTQYVDQQVEDAEHEYAHPEVVDEARWYLDALVELRWYQCCVFFGHGDNASFFLYVNIL